MKKAILTPHAPTPGNYVQARIIDVSKYYLLVIAGQTGNFSPSRDKKEPVLKGTTSQTHQALKNIEAIVVAAGGTAADSDYIDVFLDTMKDKKRFEKGYERFFTERRLEYPPRCTVQAGVPLAGEDALVELKATAYILKPNMIRGQSGRQKLGMPGVSPPSGGVDD